jgi:hypothetical protein
MSQCRCILVLLEYVAVLHTYNYLLKLLTDVDLATVVYMQQQLSTSTDNTVQITSCYRTAAIAAVNVSILYM